MAGVGSPRRCTGERSLPLPLPERPRSTCAWTVPGTWCPSVHRPYYPDAGTRNSHVQGPWQGLRPAHVPLAIQCPWLLTPREDEQASAIHPAEPAPAVPWYARHSWCPLLPRTATQYTHRCRARVCLHPWGACHRTQSAHRWRTGCLPGQTPPPGALGPAARQACPPGSARHCCRRCRRRRQTLRSPRAQARRNPGGQSTWPGACGTARPCRTRWPCSRRPGAPGIRGSTRGRAGTAVHEGGCGWGVGAAWSGRGAEVRGMGGRVPAAAPCSLRWKGLREVPGVTLRWLGGDARYGVAGG